MSETKVLTYSDIVVGASHSNFGLDAFNFGIADVCSIKMCNQVQQGKLNSISLIRDNKH